MTLKMSWEQALAWRMERQLLDPVGRLPIAGVVRRLGGVQAQVASGAELAIRVRRQVSRPGEVGRALADGRLIKTWAMRGALHLLTPDEGGVFLSLMAAGRSWERPSWQRYFGMTPKVMGLMRGVVREALAGKTLTREELVDAVTARRGLGHLDEGLRSGWGTVLKPLAWQGELCFGPSRGGRATFRRPVDASSRWAGLPDPEDAAPIAIARYLGAYGPATADGFGMWLAGGYFGRRQPRDWFDRLADQLVKVEVDGADAFILATDAEALAAARPTSAVRLLPGFDQYVLGPGTADVNVIAMGRRAAVSRQSGWISPIVVARGVVSGTWQVEGDGVEVAWFPEAGRVPRRALDAEVARLGSLLNRELRADVQVAPPAR